MTVRASLVYTGMSVFTCLMRHAGISQACDVIVYMVHCSFYGDARAYQSHAETHCRWLWMLLTISTLCWWNRRKTRYCSNAADLCITRSLHETSSIVLLLLLMCREHFCCVGLRSCLWWTKQWEFFTHSTLGGLRSQETFTLTEESVTRTTGPNLLYSYFGEKAS